jgi:hypothetical protein
MSSSNPYAPTSLYRPGSSYSYRAASSGGSTSEPYPSSAFSYNQRAWGAGSRFTYSPTASAGYQAPGYGDAATFDADVAAQQSVYTPEAASTFANTNRSKAKGKARTTVLRKGGGELWEDASLLEWDPHHFRLFVGDLGNDVSDETLAEAFSKGYNSFVKAKVVRDKFTTKSKGYGFVAYSDPEDFMKAWKQMNGEFGSSHMLLCLFSRFLFSWQASMWVRVR